MRSHAAPRTLRRWRWRPTAACRCMHRPCGSLEGAEGPSCTAAFWTRAVPADHRAGGEDGATGGGAMKLIRALPAGRRGRALGCSAAAQLSRGWQCRALLQKKKGTGGWAEIAIASAPWSCWSAPRRGALRRCAPLFARCQTCWTSWEAVWPEPWPEALEQVPWGWTARGGWPWRSWEVLGRYDKGQAGSTRTPVRSCPGMEAGPGGRKNKGGCARCSGITGRGVLVALLL